MRTHAIRYEPDRRLSEARQLALLNIYADAKVSTLIQRQEDPTLTYARLNAGICRALIAAFGVRRAKRVEFTS